MRCLALPCLGCILLFPSCWNWRKEPVDWPAQSKVWGLKPVYASDSVAKAIAYTFTPQPVLSPGNIYAYKQFIFQMDPGYGIHVIDNSVAGAASRVGFISVRGCSQISIKDDKIYTNSYDDLVVLGFSGGNTVTEISRVRSMFPTMRYQSAIAEPSEPGYYQCPDYGKLVVGWAKDSIFRTCRKQ